MYPDEEFLPTTQDASDILDHDESVGHYPLTKRSVLFGSVTFVFASFVVRHSRDL